MAAAGTGGGNSSAVRAGRAFVEIFADDKAFTAGLAGLKKKFMAWGASLTRAGAGASIFGGGILGALGLAGKSALDVGGRFKDLSVSLGATVEELEALSLAAELAGEDLESIEGAIAKMQNNIAEGGSAGGLNLGSLVNMPLARQLDIIGKMLGGIENETIRNNVAFQIFGKSGRNMAKVLADGIEEASNEMRQLSGLTTDEANRLDDAGDAITKISIALKSFVRTIGSALIGGPEGIQGIANGLKQVAPGIRAIITENSSLIQGLAIGAAAITAAGAALTAFGFAAMGVSAGISAIGAILAFATPLTLAIAAALAGAAVAAGLFVYWLREFTSVGSDFGTVWQGILNSIQSGSLAGAFRIAFIGAKLEFLKFINDVTNHWAFRILAPGISGLVDLKRAQLEAEIAAIKAELDAATGRAKEAAKRMGVGGAAFGRGALGGPTRGGFGTASQLGQQFGVNDQVKSLQNIDKNTKEIAQSVRNNGLVFA